MKKLLLIGISLFLVLSICDAQQVNGTIISTDNNVTVIKIWGTHYERGYACGFLLHDKIKALYEGYLVQQFGPYLSTAKSIVASGQHIVFDSDYIDETHGMIAGMVAAGEDTTGVDYIDLLVANSFLDVQGLISKNLGLSNGCSSLMSWGGATTGTDLDGKSVISRHLDWSTEQAIIDNQVIVVHIPAEPDEQPWLLIGFAGQISALSGINSSGTSAFQHMMSDCYASASLNMGYEPIWISIRKGLEKIDYNNDGANNVQDIRSALADNINGYADGYIVTALAQATDVADSLIAVVAEVAPQAPLQVYRSIEYDDLIPGYNLYAANYEIKRNDHLHLCSRYNGIINSIGNGKGIGTQENWALMRDYSNSLGSNIQFMQFIPMNMILNLSVYRNGIPAYIQDSTEYDLNSLFSPLTNSKKVPSTLDDLSVYPNPFYSQAVINFDPSTETPVNLTVFDLSGNKVKFIENITSDNVQFNGANLSSGVYVFHITYQNGSIKRGKFVKL